MAGMRRLHGMPIHTIQTCHKSATIGARSGMVGRRYPPIAANQRTETMITQANGAVVDMTPEQMMAEIARLAAQNDRLRQSNQRKLTLKVSEKGALSLYGMGRFPVTLYREQWERLLGAEAEIREFIADHSDKLRLKGE